MLFRSKADYTIIPNGIDLSHFNPSVEPMYQYRDGKINIVFVGRLEKRKGANYLIDAFKRIHKEHPETRLLIVGPGTRLRPKYEKMVRQAHLEKDVVFTGGVSYADLPRYYQTADICCAPATGACTLTYQASCLMPLWPVELKPLSSKGFKLTLTLSN